MLLYDSVLASQLSLHFPEHFFLRSERDIPVSAVKLYPEEEISEDVLYVVCDGTDTEALQRAGAPFLLLKQGPFTDKPSPYPNYVWDCGSAAPEAMAATVLQAVWEVMMYLVQWENRLQKAEALGESVSTCLELIGQLFPYPIALVRPDLSLAGHTPDFLPALREITGTDVGDADSAARYFSSRRESYFRPGEEAFFTCEAENGSITCYNLAESEQGDLAALFPGMNPDALSAGEIRILRRSMQALETLLTVSAPYRKRFSGDRLQRELFLNVLKAREENPAGVPEAVGKLLSALQTRGWEASDRCRVLVLRFFDRFHKLDTGDTVCTLLEKDLSNSLAVSFGEQVYWLVNCTRHPDLNSEPAFRKLLLETMDNYICRIGVSELTAGPENFTGYLRQGELALTLGSSADPHLWYYYFRDYAGDYLLGKAAEELPAELVLHRGVAALDAHDRAAGTDYVKVLETYYGCHENVSKAAETLFLHRTTLIRKLEKIREILGKLPGEAGFEEDTYIRFSLMLLQRNRTV